MKKSTLLLAGLLAANVASADEGMWTLYNLPQAVYEQMQAEGFQMPMVWYLLTTIVDLKVFAVTPL